MPATNERAVLFGGLASAWPVIALAALATVCSANDSNERIGTIDDIIIAPDTTVSYAIVGAGGFLGAARHDVAIAVSRLKVQGGKRILPGATKEALKATPAFEYGPPRAESISTLTLEERSLPCHRASRLAPRSRRASTRSAIPGAGSWP